MCGFILKQNKNLLIHISSITQFTEKCTVFYTRNFTKIFKKIQSQIKSVRDFPLVSIGSESALNALGDDYRLLQWVFWMNR